jgi:cytochrome c biogenesis protein CcdA
MVGEMMLRATKRFSMFAVALGGFLIFVGIVVIGVFLIGFLDIGVFSNIESENLQSLFLGLLLAIGLVDLVAGIILWRR